jgi:cytidylate kinase
MPVITISRQYGSHAVEVADRLCQDLNLVAFDKRLMTHVANELGLSENEMVDYSEDQYKQRGFFDALLRRSRPLGEVSSWLGGSKEGYERVVTVLDEEHAIRLVRSAIVAAHERGNVLIMGRGGQAILEGKPNTLHVRMVAPFESRVHLVMQQQGLSPAQARRLIQEHDEATREYLRTFHHIDVDDPTLYDLVLNAQRLGIEGCVHIIKQAVGQFEIQTA